MRSAFSVVTSFFVFVGAWVVAGLVALLITKTWPESMWGENVDAIIQSAFVWLIGPGTGAYAAVTLTKKWFKGVRVETIYVGFLTVVVTLMLVVFAFAVFSMLRGNPYGRSWLEVLGLVAQAAATIYGANLAKQEIRD